MHPCKFIKEFIEPEFKMSKDIQIIILSAHFALLNITLCAQKQMCVEEKSKLFLCHTNTFETE